jgi:hypothetical protein
MTKTLLTSRTRHTGQRQTCAELPHCRQNVLSSFVCASAKSFRKWFSRQIRDHHESFEFIGCSKSPDPPPISMNIINIKYIFILSDSMSSVYHNRKTKIKPHSSNVPIIVNLPVVSSLYVISQSSMKSNRDSLSNISLSRDEATKTSPLSYRQDFTILICPARLSRDGSESSKMAIYSVMAILVLVVPSQYWDRSCRSSLIGIHF